MRTALTAAKNRLEGGRRPLRQAQNTSIGPDSPPFSVWATWTLTKAHIFFDAAARSTFQPAALCRITRNTLPRPPHPQPLQSSSSSHCWSTRFPSVARTAP